jgi:hypothetical protein
MSETAGKAQQGRRLHLNVLDSLPLVAETRHERRDICVLDLPDKRSALRPIKPWRTIRASPNEIPLPAHFL